MDNCKLCVDRECAECPTFTSCSLCIEHTDGNLEDCQCQQGYTYSTKTDECIFDECLEGCLQCEEDNIVDCRLCDEGYVYMPSSTICTANCPTGFTNDGVICSGVAGCIFSLEFTNDQLFLGPWTDTINELVMTGSADGPFQVFDRGIWFDGVDDFLSVADFTLNHSFTINIWLRPFTAFDVYSSSTLSITSQGTTYLLVSDANLEGTAAIPFEIWHHLSVQVALGKGASNMKLWIDGVQDGAVDVPNYAFIDTLPRYFGRNADATNYYKGFIYSYKI